MILQEGKTQEELMHVLQELDDLSSVDSLVKNQQNVEIRCTRENSRLKNWSLSCDPQFREKPVSMGTTYNRFVAALNKMQDEETLFDSPDCTILCYLSTELAKNWDGKIRSQWIEITPGLPYQLVDGEVKFQTKEVVMEEADFAVLSKTGLAFYDARLDVYYPFTETSYISLGRLFDSALAFREVETHLLGTALFLSEKIAGLPEIRIICRTKNEHIRPILSVVGQKYKLFSQKDYFETLLNHAATKLGIYEISNWVVEDEVTRLVLEYSNQWEDFYFRVTFSTGDTPLFPFMAALEVVYQNATIPLVVNTAKHTKNFSKEKIPELLADMSEKMDIYRRFHCEMENRICDFDELWMQDIHKALGKKRVSKLQEIKSGKYLVRELWELVLTTRYMKIPERQMSEMKNALTKLLWKIMEHSEVKELSA